MGSAFSPRSRKAVIAVAAAVVVVGAGWVAARAAARPRIVISAPSVDFGSVAERKTSHLTVRNAGRAPLRVLTITTSCGCTTAQIGATEITAGASTELSITFDPLAHGPQAGPAQHAVYIRTNDPRTPEAEIEVRAVVVKGPSP
jgi:hypothetical protein